MSDSFEKWVSSKPRYCEPTWKDCEEAYLAGQSSAEQRVKELEAERDRLKDGWRTAFDCGIHHQETARLLNEQVKELRAKCAELERELEGQKKANRFLVVERDRACEQHHEVARKLFELERERAFQANAHRMAQDALLEQGAELAALKAQAGEPDPNCSCDEHGACAYCWSGKTMPRTPCTPAAERPNNKETIK